MGLSRGYDIFDAVVVGAGPAGAMTGYYLASAGLKTLIIDKKSFPRYKACGGGLTKRVLDMLPFDIRETIEEYAYTANIYIKGNLIAGRTSSYPLIGMVMRDRLDNFLVNHARSQGAQFEDDTALLSVSGTKGKLEVHTTRGRIRTKVIVGADGVNSRVAKKLHLNGNRRHMTALEAEVFLKTPLDETEYKHTVHFDFGRIKNGYGWVFPKKNQLSIGIMTVNRNAANLKQYLKNYMANKIPAECMEAFSYKGHLIPYRPAWKDGFTNETGLLVGDAAGITDPVTGEGIYYAIREAQIAADIIKEHISLNRPLSDYNARLREEMMEEMSCAQRFADILYKMPGISHRIMRSHGNRIANNHIRIIIGEKTYTRLHKEVFSLPGLRTLFFAKDE